MSLRRQVTEAMEEIDVAVDALEEAATNPYAVIDNFKAMKIGLIPITAQEEAKKIVFSALDSIPEFETFDVAISSGVIMVFNQTDNEEDRITLGMIHLLNKRFKMMPPPTNQDEPPKQVPPDILERKTELQQKLTKKKGLLAGLTEIFSLTDEDIIKSELEAIAISEAAVEKNHKQWETDIAFVNSQLKAMRDIIVPMLVSHGFTED